MNTTHLNKKRPVLVIDDSFYDLLIARETLEDVIPPEEILCMDSAEKALRFLKEKQEDSTDLPRIIFLDIRMPVMDGFQFLDQYATLPDGLRKQCGIFMLTSSIDPADLNRAEKNPYILSFLEKPLSEEQITTILEQHCD